MNSKSIVTTVIVIALTAVGIWYWLSRPEPVKTTGDAIKAVSETSYIDVTSQSNLAGKVPDANPVSRTNPFKDVYSNPFAP